MMEENNLNNTPDVNGQVNNTSQNTTFVPAATNSFNNNSNNNFSNNSFTPKKKKESSFSFGKNIFIPFISGLAGTILCISLAFGSPVIRGKLLNSSSNISTPTQQVEPSIQNPTASAINLADYSNTSIKVASDVLPSIVGISVKYNVTTFFGTTEAEATGSGIIISEDGYIVTNNHVIASENSSSYYSILEATGISVTLYGEKTEYPATIVGSDAYTDLAVLKIDCEGLVPATLGDSDSVQVGEFAMAIGNPLGMTSTVTTGIVSALNREIESDDGTVYVTIQTDAAINSGNSGGALVNADGKVIGINTLKLGGEGVEGMGFAIPINSAKSVIDQLIEFQTVKRPALGITATAITEDQSKRYNVPVGVYVESVEKDSSADEAGLKVGDIITELNGKAVTNVTELNREKNNYKIGDEITLKVYTSKSKDYKDIKLTLKEQLTTEGETTQQTPSTKRR
jgi:serine protease Do